MGAHAGVCFVRMVCDAGVFFAHAGRLVGRQFMGSRKNGDCGRIDYCGRACGLGPVGHSVGRGEFEMGVLFGTFAAGGGYGFVQAQYVVDCG